MPGLTPALPPTIFYPGGGSPGVPTGGIAPYTPISVIPISGSSTALPTISNNSTPTTSSNGGVVGVLENVAMTALGGNTTSGGFSLSSLINSTLVNILFIGLALIIVYVLITGNDASTIPAVTINAVTKATKTAAEFSA